MEGFPLRRRRPECGDGFINDGRFEITSTFSDDYAPVHTADLAAD